MGVASAVSGAWILAAARVDMLCRQLPDALVALAVVPTAMASAVVTLQGSTTALVGSGLGAAAWGLPLLIGHVIAPGSLGFGDAKAAASIGAAIGLTQHLIVVASGLVVGLASAVTAGRRAGDRDLPLGPHLVAGAVAALAIGSLSSEFS